MVKHVDARAARLPLEQLLQCRPVQGLHRLVVLPVDALWDLRVNSLLVRVVQSVSSWLAQVLLTLKLATVKPLASRVGLKPWCSAWPKFWICTSCRSRSRLVWCGRWSAGGHRVGSERAGAVPELRKSCSRTRLLLDVVVQLLALGHPLGVVHLGRHRGRRRHGRAVQDGGRQCCGLAWPQTEALAGVHGAACRAPRAEHVRHDGQRLTAAAKHWAVVSREISGYGKQAMANRPAKAVDCIQSSDRLSPRLLAA